MIIKLTQAHIMGTVIAYLIGVCLVPLVISFSKKEGLVDVPNERKIHTKPISRIGGVAIWASTMLTFLCLVFLSYYPYGSLLSGILLGSSLMFLLGLVDDNSWGTRLGMDFNFNIGKEKAWAISLKPSLVYDMEGDFNRHKSRFNANNARVELLAGITYYIKGSSGRHHATLVKEYNQTEVDNLNASVNSLRGQLSDSRKQTEEAVGRADMLQKQLAECQNKKPVIETVIEKAKTLESIVTFRQGSSKVDVSQLPNVERIASYMNRHPESKVVIKGYSSPEGSIEVNERIARARAESVKSILTKKYRIAASRITAEGQGIGDMFSEPDWNRVSICTLQENK